MHVTLLFLTQNTFYKQKFGLPMGSLLSGVPAYIYFEFLQYGPFQYIDHSIVEGDLKAPFSIATTPRCREGCYSFPWIAPLYP